jgi:hypothetical protein
MIYPLLSKEMSTIEELTAKVRTIISTQNHEEYKEILLKNNLSEEELEFNMKAFSFIPKQEIESITMVNATEIPLPNGYVSGKYRYSNNANPVGGIAVLFKKQSNGSQDRVIFPYTILNDRYYIVATKKDING